MGEEGVRQTKKLPFFCLANHNVFKRTVITMSNLSYYLIIKLLKRVYSVVMINYKVYARL